VSLGGTVSDQVQLALIAAGVTLATLIFNTLIMMWTQARDRQWKRQDAEWKKQTEVRSNVAAEERQTIMAQAETLQAEVKANTALTGASTAAAVKAAAHLTGEPEHKVLADIQADVHRRLDAVVAPFLHGRQDATQAAQEPPGPGSLNSGARTHPPARSPR
jgi:C4-dicarboxylate-specific signal transduction histidine kinase